MDHWELAGFRRRLAAGELLDLEEQRTLVQSLVELDRTVRLPAEFRSGDSVGVHAAYEEAASRLLPEASVRNVRGWISPAALPLDLVSLDHLVADPPDLTAGDLWATHFTLFWLSDRSAAAR